MRRLRNSTWEGTHNVPSHGTRTVLVDIPSSSRAARRASRGTQGQEPKLFRHDRHGFSQHAAPSTFFSFLFPLASFLCFCPVTFVTTVTIVTIVTAFPGL